MFKLHPKLEEGLVPIGRLSGSLAFLLPDSDNPWVVLVPEVADITELHQLNENQQLALLKDINLVSSCVESKFQPDKLNIGALGNMVPQLHIHIICRYKDDKAWPNSIWGSELGADQNINDSRLALLKQELLNQNR